MFLERVLRERIHKRTLAVGLSKPKLWIRTEHHLILFIERLWNNVLF